MLMLQDLRMSNCNRLSSSGRVMCRLAIYYNFSENKTLVVQSEIYDVCSAQKIYNVVAKIKRNRMQGKKHGRGSSLPKCTKGYTVFHRNREESNILSDIVVAHPTSIAMIRTWLCVLVMDTTYKTNKEMDSEMRDLTSLIHEISMGPISKVREVKRLIKSVISLMLPEDPCQPLTTLPETAITKGRRKTNSTKRDKFLLGIRLRRT
ncbi:hypothetical protein M9H77_03666 [Catharanthus roseus]|uniref:Uncharacterized protein n=1 Tax=Catharanthus roseus TaxID=4058 RepID=A0ACC0CCE6_CATRO|nr:hypothetical protein M9H77_03666 [Catharanthus roseus]